jgi:chromodomain-helicase-DNA-binding protein 7
MKEDVEKGLPPKEETIIDVELTGTQRTYYKALYGTYTHTHTHTHKPP